MPRSPAALALAAVLAGCGGPDEPHDCDAGTPTCDSSLRVLLPDARTQFDVTVDLGVVVEVSCPQEEAVVVGEYTATCGAGQVTFETNGTFPDSVEVGLEEAVPETFTPDYQRGSDFCQNPCAIGTIAL